MTISIEVQTMAYILGVIQIVLELGAAYYGYKIYQFNRLSKIWLAVPIGIALLAIRRSIVLFHLTYMEDVLVQFDILTRIIIPLAVGILLFWGMKEIYKQFSSFNVVEKSSEEKTKQFKKGKK
jgi:hypothetical protein